MRLDRLAHKGRRADRDLWVLQGRLVRSAHQGITDRLETTDKMEPPEVQEVPGPLDGPDPLDVWDTLDTLEQRGS